MKRIFLLIVFFFVSCKNNEPENHVKLKIFDNSMNLIMEDNLALMLESPMPNKIFVKTSNSQMLESITKSNIGKSVYVKLNHEDANKFIVTESISNGVLFFIVDDHSAQIFNNESDAVDNLIKMLPQSK